MLASVDDIRTYFITDIDFMFEKSVLANYLLVV